MTTVITKSDRIIKVVSREEWKSTITTFFDKVGQYTNADDVVAATGMDNMEAAVLVDKMRYESISKKEDFTFETVLSSEYKLNI